MAPHSKRSGFCRHPSPSYIIIVGIFRFYAASSIICKSSAGSTRLFWRTHISAAGSRRKFPHRLETVDRREGLTDPFEISGAHFVPAFQTFGTDGVFSSKSSNRKTIENFRATPGLRIHRSECSILWSCRLIASGGADRGSSAIAFLSGGV